MKKTILIAVIFCSMFAVQTAKAQDPITTLQHAGTTKVFYGTTSFVDAYNASVNGDSLLLSIGEFTAPTSPLFIAKNITMIGAGHFPNSLIEKKRTSISGDLSFGIGADSIHIEGLYVNGAISTGLAGINCIKINRCKTKNIAFNKWGTGLTKYVLIEDNFIDETIGLNYDKISIIKHNIIGGYISQISSNAIIEGNIFLSYNPLVVSSSIIRNNIFLASSKILEECNNCSFSNNLLISTFSYKVDMYGHPYNVYNNNYEGVAIANIFANQIGSTIDYNQDYHLKTPSAYLGTDGTQVGLYGGIIPFKDGGYPSNPQILTKSVSTQTDVSGNLNISFKVKAQDN